MANFVVNLLAALVASTYQEKKPSLNLHPDDLAALPATIFNLSYVELTLSYGCAIHFLAIHYLQHRLNLFDLIRRAREKILRDHDQVGEFARLDRNECHTNCIKQRTPSLRGNTCASPVIPLSRSFRETDRFSSLSNGGIVVRDRMKVDSI